MKNKDGKSLLLLLAYILFGIGAIGFGYLVYTSKNNSNYIYAFLCLLAMIAIIILKYFYDINLANKKAKILRNVYVNDFDNDKDELMPLVHIDDVADDKIIISVYKKKVSKSNVIGMINNQ